MEAAQHHDSDSHQHVYLTRPLDMEKETQDSAFTGLRLRLSFEVLFSRQPYSMMLTPKYSRARTRTHNPNMSRSKVDHGVAWMEPGLPQEPKPAPLHYSNATHPSVLVRCVMIKACMKALRGILG